MKTASLYQESIRYLNDHINFEAFAKPQQSTYKLDLSHLMKYIKPLNLDQGLPPIIHVAGTKGKGTISMLLEKALRLSGKKTGLFSSPHLYQVNERVRINGQPLSDDQFSVMITNFRSTIEASNLPPLSYFEILTLASMQYFQSQSLDFIILETGLGGRLDSTNIFQSALAIISTIDYDHTHILGNTLPEIAAEKAGIMKTGSPAICLFQNPTVNEVFVAIAKEKQATIDWARKEHINSDNLNDFEKENFSLIQLAMKHLTKSYAITFAENLIEALYDTKLPGRFETFIQDNHPDQTQTVVIDVSHNHISFQFLLQKKISYFKDQPITLIVALSNDKSPEGLVDIIKALNCKLYFLPVPNNPRLMSTKQLKEIFPQGIELPNFDDGLATILKDNKTQPLIFTGSFYLAGEVGRYFNRTSIY